MTDMAPPNRPQSHDSALSDLSLGELLAVVASEASEYPFVGSARQKSAWDEIKARFAALEDAAPGIRGSSHRPTGEARGEGNEPLTGAAEEVASHVAALDSLETILFGDCWRRSRDELEARATDLVAKEKNLDATLRFMP